MDKEFSVDSEGLHQAVELMSRDFSSAQGLDLPVELPQLGIGSTAALNSLAPNILGGPSSLWFTQSIYQWYNTGGMSG